MSATKVTVACALALLLCVFATAQDQQPQQQQEQSDGTTANMGGYGDMNMGFNPAMGQVAAMQSSQQMSSFYAKFFLEFQSVMAWVQASNAFGQNALAMQEDADDADFEEQDDNDSSAKHHDIKQMKSNLQRQLETIPGPLVGQVDPNAERPDPVVQFEDSVLYITKLLQIENVYKLDQAQRSHYQTKVQLMMIGSAGQGNPYLSSLLYMLWYKDIIDTLNSAIAFQMQDSWTFWIYNEITSTNEFPDAESETFEHTRLQSKAVAMNMWYMRNLLDIQSMYMGYYTNSIMMALAQGAGAANPSVAQPTSMLEVEEGAEPSKPFVSPANGPFLLAYYYSMLSFWGKFQELQTASTLSLVTQFELNADKADEMEAQNPMYSLERLTLTAASSMQQWIWVRAMQVVMQMYIMFTGLAYSMGSFGPGGSFGHGSFGHGSFGAPPQQGMYNNLMQETADTTTAAPAPAVDNVVVPAQQQEPAAAAAPEQPVQPNLVG